MPFIAHRARSGSTPERGIKDPGFLTLQIAVCKCDSREFFSRAAIKQPGGALLQYKAARRGNDDKKRNGEKNDKENGCNYGYGA
jgi:hypothetical protein